MLCVRYYWTCHMSQLFSLGVSSFMRPLKMIKTVLFHGWLWRWVALNCLCLKRCSVSSRALKRGNFSPHSWAAEWVRGGGHTAERGCTTGWKREGIAVIKTILYSTCITAHYQKFVFSKQMCNEYYLSNHSKWGNLISHLNRIKACHWASAAMVLPKFMRLWTL